MPRPQQDQHAKDFPRPGSQPVRNGDPDFAGLSALLMAWLAADVALLVWLHQSWAWSWIHAALGVMGVNLLLSALFLRIGGLMTKGPYLPETLAGLTKTTRALVGR